MLADRRLASLLLAGIDHSLGATGQQVADVIGRAVKFLRADHEIHVRQSVDQLPPAALRHAAHEAQHRLAVFRAQLRRDMVHFAERLLLGGIAHAARVEQNDIRRQRIRRHAVALGHQLRRDRLGVALVHLATVRFYEDTRHPLLTAHCSLNTSPAPAPVRRPSWPGRRENPAR